MIESISSRMKPRNEKEKKNEEDARSRRKQEKLIWSINLARGSVSDFQTISRSRGFNAVFSLFLFFWRSGRKIPESRWNESAVDKGNVWRVNVNVPYDRRRESFRLTLVSTSDSWNSVMPTPGVNNPSLIVTPPPPDNSH